jgi:hypothetical protein
MRVRDLGPGWDLCRVRGTRRNMGEGIFAALAIDGAYSATQALGGKTEGRD